MRAAASSWRMDLSARSRFAGPTVVGNRQQLLWWKIVTRIHDVGDGIEPGAERGHEASSVAVVIWVTSSAGRSQIRVKPEVHPSIHSHHWAVL